MCPKNILIWKIQFHVYIYKCISDNYTYPFGKKLLDSNIFKNEAWFKQQITLHGSRNMGIRSTEIQALQTHNKSWIYRFHFKTVLSHTSCKWTCDYLKVGIVIVKPQLLENEHYMKNEFSDKIRILMEYFYIEITQ